MPKTSWMARAGDYEIDDQGNLVESGAGVAADQRAGEAQPVTASARAKFLRLLLLSDVVGVLVLVGCSILLPNSRTILLIVAAAYAVMAVPVYLLMSRSTQRRVEESERLQASS